MGYRRLRPGGGRAAGRTAVAAGVIGAGHEPSVPVPAVLGPVPDTLTSYAFGRPAFSLAAYGYEQQEFFVKGTANL
jgi:hypothetical protein